MRPSVTTMGHGNNQPSNEELLRYEENFDFLRRVVTEFAPEEHELGVDARKIEAVIEADQTRFDAIAKDPGLKRFPDVPLDNWALQELRELRAAHLLDGYPDGKFHG